MALDGTISQELKAAHDYMFDNATIPQNTTLTGDAQLVGGTQAELELVAVVGATAFAVADTKVITVKLTGSATEGGSFADVDTLFSLTAAAGSGAIAAGTELGRYVVSPTDPLWGKAVIITDDAAATGTIDFYIRRIAR